MARARSCAPFWAVAAAVPARDKAWKVSVPPVQAIQCNFGRNGVAEKEVREDKPRRILPQVDSKSLRTPRAAGVAGALFSILFVTAYYLVRFPPTRLGDTEAQAWFEQHGSSDLTLAGLYLVPFAGVAFLYFVGVIRDRIGRHEDKFFSTVFQGAGLLLIAMSFIGMAALGSLAFGERFLGETVVPDAHLIRFTRSVSANLFYIYGAKMAGVFVLVTGTIALRTHIFARWVVIISYIAGLILVFYIGVNLVLVTLFPAWVMFLSIYMIVTYRRSGGQADEERMSAG
jgi:hypothetical protein